MKKNIIKTLSTVFILTAVSKVLGLLRDVVFAGVYGTGIEATAYFAALKIPTQIVDIVLSSAIVSTFIPVFNEVLEKNGKEKANTFARNFISIIAVIATFISIVGILLAPMLVRWLASGFEGEVYTLTVSLVRITFPMIIFTALAFSFVGFLQSYGEFNIPASISGLSNLAVIIFLLFFSSKTGINGLCYFIVFAWFLQVFVQLPFAKKFGYDFKFNIDFKDENIRKVFKLAIPILISTAVLPINNLVSMNFASNMQEGSVPALEYAYRLYIVIYGTFSYAIGNIIFPELSRESNKKDNNGFIALIHKSMHLIAFLLIPLTIGILIYSKDIISVIYQRGEFTPESTILTALALFYYAIGIIGAGMVEIMNKSFYAKQDTKTPLCVGIIVIISNLFLCYIFSSTSLGYAGLALATAVNALINGLILTIILDRHFNGVINKSILEYIGKVFVSALVMGYVVILLNNLLGDYLFGSTLKDLLRMMIGAGTGVVIYFVSTYLLRVNEITNSLKKE